MNTRTGILRVGIATIALLTSLTGCRRESLVDRMIAQGHNESFAIGYARGLGVIDHPDSIDSLDFERGFQAGMRDRAAGAASPPPPPPRRPR